MKNKKTFIVLALLIAVLMLGVGYAAVTSIPLNINGTAKTLADQTNFVVEFTAASADVAQTVAPSFTKDAGSFTIDKGLSEINDTVVVTYEITNKSTEIIANLTALPTPTVTGDTEYFDVTAAYNGETTLNPGEKTEVKVTVKLKQTVVEDKNITVGVAFNADPVQPEVK